jgi:hypothetical protein
MPKANKNKDNLPAVYEEPLAIVGKEEMFDAIATNLKTENVTANDLHLITVPGSGGTNWEIDENTSAKAIQGVILNISEGRAYWSTPYEESGGGPPDCSSTDLINGFGNPGGQCETCPMNAFGSSVKGEGKACKEHRMIALLPLKKPMPVMIRIPVQSLGNLRAYLLELSFASRLYNNVVSTLSLEKTKNKAGVPYSKVVYQRNPQPLSEDNRKSLALFLEAFSGLIQQRQRAATITAGQQSATTQPVETVPEQPPEGELVEDVINPGEGLD